MVHISTGDLLRAAAKDNQMLADCMKAGKLVSSDITVDLLLKRMMEDPTRIYLLDGFPRNKENCECLKKKCGDMMCILECIYIDCSDETMMTRCMERAAAAEVKREDDNEETMKARFNCFKTETMPIVEMCKKGMGMAKSFFQLDGNKTADEVYEECDAHLKSCKMLCYSEDPVILACLKKTQQK